ncbi:hypothetical protein PR048_010047 [Dryococelus australis]|uniref:Uncharacterized protein n=1 Tax=Dryococelus australis TaxID=614101 RepID=A0ABQ9I1N5_9NEOP|nr:hypothetical protein PR048_010047 [Dryococelus australis]
MPTLLMVAGVISQCLHDVGRMSHSPGSNDLATIKCPDILCLPHYVLDCDRYLDDQYKVRRYPVVRDGATAAYTTRLSPRQTGIAPVFWHVGLVLDDAAGRRVFSGISRFPHPFIPAVLRTRLASPSSVLKTAMLRVTQISPLPTVRWYKNVRRRGNSLKYKNVRRRGNSLKAACSPLPQECCLVPPTSPPKADIIRYLQPYLVLVQASTRSGAQAATGLVCLISVRCKPYTSDSPTRKRFNGERSGERAGHGTGPPLPIHLRGYTAAAPLPFSSQYPGRRDSRLSPVYRVCIQGCATDMDTPHFKSWCNARQKSDESSTEFERSTAPGAGVKSSYSGSTPSHDTRQIWPSEHRTYLVSPPSADITKLGSCDAGVSGYHMPRCKHANWHKLHSRHYSIANLRRTLKKAVHNGKVARKKPYICKIKRRKRLKFAKDYQYFGGKKLWFADERTFNVHDSDRQIVWRKLNQELATNNLRETIKLSGMELCVSFCCGVICAAFHRQREIKKVIMRSELQIHDGVSSSCVHAFTCRRLCYVNVTAKVAQLVLSPLVHSCRQMILNTGTRVSFGSGFRPQNTCLPLHVGLA